MYLSEKQIDNFFDYLNVLDCCRTSEEEMIEELNKFEEDERQQIGALIWHNTVKRHSYTVPFIRLFYVISGSVRFATQGKSFDVQAGCLILANQWANIEYEELEKGSQVIGFYFKKDYFNDSLLAQFVDETLIYKFFVESIKQDSQASHYFIFQFSPTDDVHLYILVLLKQVIKMERYNNKITKSSFVLLIVEVSRLAEKGLQIENSSLPSKLLVEEILGYIQTNLATVCLKDVAKKFNFHPNYLSAFISKNSERSFSEWVKYYRLSYALDYLKETSLPINKIIEEIGYTDQAFFFKIFKKEFHVTPGTYRKNFQELKSNQ